MKLLLQELINVLIESSVLHVMGKVRFFPHICCVAHGLWKIPNWTSYDFDNLQYINQSGRSLMLLQSYHRFRFFN